MIKVVELKGFKSMRAFNAFHTLLLGLKMIPEFMGESYEEFLKRIDNMSELEQADMFRSAVRHVPLEKEEIEAMLCFCVDKNGIPYGPANLKELGPAEISDRIVAVCMAIASMKVDMVTEDEKKN